MSSSDYTEVELDNRREIPPDIREALAELSGSRDLSDDEILDKVVANRKITQVEESRMRRWMKFSAGERERWKRDPKSLIEQCSDFPIGKSIEKIVSTMAAGDVTLVIAPTGSGKSITAPILADLLDRKLDGPTDARYHKTLHCGPSVEHSGSTIRAFEKLFKNPKFEISAFLNTENEQRATGEGKGKIKLLKRSEADAMTEFAYTTYHLAVQELPHAVLDLLILDEVHEANDNVQVTIAMAAKKMLAVPFDSLMEKGKSKRKGSRTLNKLLLLTATMDEDQRKKHEKYFTSQGLSFNTLDLSYLNRNNQLTMSCLTGTPLPENFQITQMAGQILEVLEKKGGVSLSSLEPDQRDQITRMIASLNSAMGQAAENLRERLKKRGGDYDMQSIIVILPGLEQVDKVYSACRSLPNFNFDDQPGFLPVRQTSLVKDDPSITTECTKQGKWEGGNKDGHLGRIVLTTNFVASGLTVPNAAYVLDMGRQNIPAEYARNGLLSLESIWIDKMMLIQRAGRTGRTTDGEYFMPYSVEKVDKIIKTDHGEVLLNRNFEEKHFFLKTYYKLRLIHSPPEKLMKELQSNMENRGLYCPLNGFSKDAILMYSLFNMLTPEQARFVVQGTRLGIAAHAVYLVANEKSRIKFCTIGTKNRGESGGPSEDKSAVDLYCEDMDEMEVIWGWSPKQDLPKEYRGVGDSIGLADLLVSFYSQGGRKMKDPKNDLIKKHINNNFWSGNRDNRQVPFCDLYASFVKEEGDDAVSRYAEEIEWALVRAGIIRSSVFDVEVNRHIVSEGSYCLDDNGRTLISALLTMHSSRIGKMEWNRGRQVLHIHNENTNTVELLYPESSHAQPWKSEIDEIMYGRYSDMFKKSGKFTGLIDPVNLKQLVFFFNLNGVVHIRSDQRENSFTFEMNASTGKSGMKIMTSKSICDDADLLRSELERAMKVLTLPPESEDFIKNLERFIIKLWKECDKTEDSRNRASPTSSPERSPPVSTQRRSSPPPTYSSIYGNGRPETMLEWKEREALNNSTARPAAEREAAGGNGGTAGAEQRGGGGGRLTRNDVDAIWDRGGRAVGGIGGGVGGAQRGGGSGRGGMGQERGGRVGGIGGGAQRGECGRGDRRGVGQERGGRVADGFGRPSRGTQRGRGSGNRGDRRGGRGDRRGPKKEREGGANSTKKYGVHVYE